VRILSIAKPLNSLGVQRNLLRKSIALDGGSKPIGNLRVIRSSVSESLESELLAELRRNAVFASESCAPKKTKSELCHTKRLPQGTWMSF
jgi:hypothetical protein